MITMLEFNEMLIPLDHPNRKGTKITPIACVIHYTANDSPTATDTNNVKYASRPYVIKDGVAYEAGGKTKFRYGSAQWYIDEDSATLAIPTDEVAWGCGDRQLPYDNGCKGQTKIARDIFGYNQNYKTINYEICNNGDWNKACANAIEIIADDMIKYGISDDMIFRHHDLTGKICPKPFVDNPNAWEMFKQEVIKAKEKKLEELVDMKIEQWMIDMGIKAVNSLKENGLVNNPEEWASKMGENTPNWLFFVMLDRLAKKKVV